MGIYPITIDVEDEEIKSKVIRTWSCPGGAKALHHVVLSTQQENNELYLIVFHYPSNCLRHPIIMCSGATEEEALANEETYQQEQAQHYVEKCEEEHQRRVDAERLGYFRRPLNSRSS